MEKVVWKLSDDEQKEIEELYEKKIALENLTQIVDINNKELYNQLVFDYGITIRIFNEWWSRMSSTNLWEGTQWHINFETGEVILNIVN